MRAIGAVDRILGSLTPLRTAAGQTAPTTTMDTPSPSPLELAGLTILAFESRRAEEMRRLLESRGATVLSAPAMREVPLAPSVVESVLAELEASRIEVLILLTGVGTRALVAALSRYRERATILAWLARLPIVARGPKPVTALRELGLTPRLVAPEPNTWRELLATLDAELPVKGRRVAVQEYGKPARELLDGLTARGALVLRVPVYRWALPEDCGPLEAGIEALVHGGVDVVAFTTAVQLDHLLEVAGARREAVIGALRSTVVASIGPTASLALRSAGIEPDLEPEHPKLGWLVRTIAGEARVRLASRRGGG